MRDKTKDQLVSELATLRQKVSELEASEAGRRVAEDMPGLGEGWYRRIIEAAHEGVWVIDTEGNTEYVNRRMAVVDDGQGFETKVHREGMGMSGMREGARALGGELEVECEPGRGTRVRVTF